LEAQADQKGRSIPRDGSDKGNKEGKIREIPKLIKKALAKADLTQKLNESTLITSPMSEDMVTQVEKMRQLPNLVPTACPLR
jgi:hypothetical protein